MGKLPMAWWSLFYISYFTLLGNGDARKGLTQAMKGRPYYKGEAIINTFEFDGDVIDCIDIYKQPAFDHPLLQNHTIQMKPSFEPKSSTEYSKTTALNGSTIEDTHPRFFTKGCPKGSIPITRKPYMNGIVRNDTMTSDSQIRHSRYLHKLGGIKKTNSLELREYAVIYIADENKLYGARAKFNVYRPTLELPEEMSLAQIWIMSEDLTTTLEAGWIVNPLLYGDDKTRFFTFWTNDGYQESSCYNLECPGFVWVHQEIALDTVLVPSVHGGQQQYITIEIFQDMESKDWWLKFDGQTVGYWPSTIVQKLDDGAYYHNFGGEILNSGVTGEHTMTEMGSGDFASEGEGKAASIKKIEITRDSDLYMAPNDYVIDVTDPNCYNFQLGLYIGEEWGLYFYYGGPGKSEICP